MTINTSNFANHFLIAMPKLHDSNFEKSVVFIYEHNAEGAMGLIINKPLQINLGNVLSHLNIATSSKKIETHPVLMGGPIHQEHGFVVYENAPEKNEILISASKEMLCDIADGKGPKQFIITLGYSGWGAGQLEQEMHRNDWLIAPMSNLILFDLPLNQRWQESAKLIGIDINQLSDQVGHA